MGLNFTKATGRDIAAVLMFLLLCCCSAVAQSQTVQGTVSDGEGVPLPGVTVLLRGTSIGTSTDTNGSFKLTAPEPLTTQDALVFSFIGFKTLEVLYSGNTAIDVQRCILQQQHFVLRQSLFG